MTEKIPDLWPQDFGVTEITTPLHILKRQATALAEKTKGILQGAVQSSIMGGGELFTHEFLIKAPIIGGYTYKLLTAYHKISFYPIQITFHAKNLAFEAKDEEGFEATLTQIFSEL